MKKPIIGITTLRMTNKWGLLYHAITEAYMTSIQKAGGVPVLIPLGLPEDDLHTLHQVVDGILLTGGGDINPDLYDTDTHPTVHRVDPDRDRVEIYLAQDAVEHSKPFLGVCRGMQIINVAMGGTLYQDIESQHPNGHKHNFYPGHPRDMIAHAVKVDEETRIAKIVEEPILQVNSLHHQAVNKIGKGLTATGHSPDGIIESFEMPDHPYGLAVQWHPEWLPEQAPMQRLFRSFVEASAHGNGTA